MATNHGGLNSESGGEVHEFVSRSPSKRSQDARLHGSSRMAASCRDPLPDYIDPELVKLIAKNAPLELDLFLDCLNTKSKHGIDHRKFRHSTAPQRETLRAGISSLWECSGPLASRKIRNGPRRSCPDRLWSDSDEEAGAHVKYWKYAVKRKRLTSSDRQWIMTADNEHDAEDKLLGSCRFEKEVRDGGRDKFTSVASSDRRSLQAFGANHPPIENLPTGRPISSADADRDKRNAKSWRHGMRKERKDKGESKEETLPEPFRCKRKAQSESRTPSEVRKYMEFKQTERKKEQNQIKAETIAAHAAREEQQRKLDSHIQALQQAQKSSRKKRNRPQRPVWVSDCFNVGEAAYLWSASSVESSADLPAPLTPPEPEAEPLDLYSTRRQYAELLSPPTGISLEHVHRINSMELPRTRSVEEDSYGVQRHLKSVRVDAEKHSIRKHLDKPRTTRKTRQKTSWATSRGSPIAEPQRYLDENDFPMKHNVMEIHGGSNRAQLHQERSSHFKAGRASSRSQNARTGHADLFPISAFESKTFVKSRVDHPSLTSKVKRLKPTNQTSSCEGKPLQGRRMATPFASRGQPDGKPDNHPAFTLEKTMMKASRSSSVPEGETVIDCEAGNMGHVHHLKNISAVKPKDLISLESSGASSESRWMYHKSYKRNRGALVDPLSLSGKEVEIKPFKVCQENDGSCFEEEGDVKNLTGDVRHQRMHLLKSLAAQLVSQVDAACSKKSQLEKCVKDRPIALPIDTESDAKTEPFLVEPGHKFCHDSKFLDDELHSSQEPMNTELLHCVNPPGLFRVEKPLDVEVAMVMKSKEHSIPHCDRLTEQEQAGCAPKAIQRGELGMKEKLDTSNLEAAVSKAGAISSHSAGENLYPIFHISSYQSCLSALPLRSPRTSSPVILPTTTKYHMNRIKHSKSSSRAAEDHEETERKSKWSQPVSRGTNIPISSCGQTSNSNAATTLSPDTSDRLLSVEDIDARQMRSPSSESSAAPVENEVGIPTPSSPSSRLWSHAIDQDWRAAYVSEFCSGPGESSATATLIAKSPSKLRFTDGEKATSLQLYELGKSQVKAMLLKEDRCFLSENVENGEPPGIAGAKNSELFEARNTLKPFPFSTSIPVRMDMFQEDLDRRKSEDTKLALVKHSPRECGATRENLSGGSFDETVETEQCSANWKPSVKVNYARPLLSGMMSSASRTAEESVVIKMSQRKPWQDVVEISGSSGTPDISGRQAREETWPPDSKNQQKGAVDKRAALLVIDAPKDHEIWMFTGNKEGQRICVTESSLDLEGDTTVALRERHSSESRGGRFDRLVSQRESDGDVGFNEPSFCSSTQVAGKLLTGDLQGLQVENRTSDGVSSMMVSCDWSIKSANDQILALSNNSNPTELVIHEQVTESMVPERKTNTGLSSSNDGGLFPVVDPQNCQAWELKMRREKLEAELKRLDIQIMNSRAKLHQTPFGFQQPGQISSRICADADSVGTLNVNKSDREHSCHALKDQELLTEQAHAQHMEWRLERNLCDHSNHLLLRERCHVCESSTFCQEVEKNTKALSTDVEFVSSRKGLKDTIDVQNLDYKCTDLRNLNDNHGGVQDAHHYPPWIGGRHLIGHQTAPAIKVGHGQLACGNEGGSSSRSSGGKELSGQKGFDVCGSDNTELAESFRARELGGYRAQEFFMGAEKSDARNSSRSDTDKLGHALPSGIQSQGLTDNVLGRSVQAMEDQEANNETIFGRRFGPDNIDYRGTLDTIQQSRAHAHEMDSDSDPSGVPIVSSAARVADDSSATGVPPLHSRPLIMGSKSGAAASKQEFGQQKGKNVHCADVARTSKAYVSTASTLECERPLSAPPLSDKPSTAVEEHDISSYERIRFTGLHHKPHVVIGDHQEKVSHAGTVYRGSSDNTVAKTSLSLSQALPGTSSPSEESVGKGLTRKEVSKASFHIIATSPVDYSSILSEEEVSQMVSHGSGVLARRNIVSESLSMIPQELYEDDRRPANLLCAPSIQELSSATAQISDCAAVTPPSLPEFNYSASSEFAHLTTSRALSDNSPEPTNSLFGSVIEETSAKLPQAMLDESSFPPIHVVNDVTMRAAECTSSSASTLEIATAIEPLNTEICDEDPSRQDVNVYQSASRKWSLDSGEGDSEMEAAAFVFPQSRDRGVSFLSLGIQPVETSKIVAEDVGYLPTADVSSGCHSPSRLSALSDRQECTSLAAGTIAPTRDRYSFLPHIPGRQKADNEETESMISENLESYDSDIPEDLQGDESRIITSSGDFQVVPNLMLEVAASETPAGFDTKVDVLCDLGSGNAVPSVMHQSEIGHAKILSPSTATCSAPKEWSFAISQVEGESSMIYPLQSDELINLSARPSSSGPADSMLQAKTEEAGCTLPTQETAEGLCGPLTYCAGDHEADSMTLKLTLDSHGKEKPGSIFMQVVPSAKQMSSEKEDSGSDSSQLPVGETLCINSSAAVSSFSQAEAPVTIDQHCSLPAIRGALKMGSDFSSSYVPWGQTSTLSEQGSREEVEAGDESSDRVHEPCDSDDSSISGDHASVRWPSCGPPEALTSRPSSEGDCTSPCPLVSAASMNIHANSILREVSDLDLSCRSRLPVEKEALNEEVLLTETLTTRAMLTMSKMILPDLPSPVVLGTGNGKFPALRRLPPLDPIGTLPTSKSSQDEGYESTSSDGISAKKLVDNQCTAAGIKNQSENPLRELGGSLSEMGIVGRHRNEKIDRKSLNATADEDRSPSTSASSWRDDLRLAGHFQDETRTVYNSPRSLCESQPGGSFATASEQGSADPTCETWLKKEVQTSIWNSSDTNASSSELSSGALFTGTDSLPLCKPVSDMLPERPDQIIEMQLRSTCAAQLGPSPCNSSAGCFTSCNGGGEQHKLRVETLEEPFSGEHHEGDMKECWKSSSIRAQELKGPSGSFFQEGCITQLEAKARGQSDMINMKEEISRHSKTVASDSSVRSFGLFRNDACSQAGNVRVGAPIKQERHEGLVNVLTDALYEDLLTTELSGSTGGRPALPKQKSKQKVGALALKSCSSASKSGKSSDLCLLLKHFLPTGWRCVSAKQKKNLFLRESYHWHREVQKLNQESSSSRVPLLDLDNLHVIVKTTLQELGLDASSCSKDHTSSHAAAVDLGGEGKKDSHWKAIISDLVHELLLEQDVGNKSFFPSGEITQAGGTKLIGYENLVHLVTSRIVDHERLVSSCRLDVDKTVAQAFRDQNWDPCRTERDHILDDVTNAILLDLIQDVTCDVCS